jgi:hypothetical protein
VTATSRSAAPSRRGPGCARAAPAVPVAARAGYHYLAASSASRDHHDWSDQPWTTGFSLSPRGAAAYHPNAAGMRGVADLLVDTLGRPPRPGDRPALRRLSASRVH